MRYILCMFNTCMSTYILRCVCMTKSLWTGDSVHANKFGVGVLLCIYVKTL